MAKQPKTTSEHLISIYGYITGLRREVSQIKNNHLKHLHQDVDKLHNKIDKLLYAILGGLGAIEAVISTGGQIMPPVMGAAAFIMAEIIGKPYTEIMKAGIIPALLFFISTFFVVHFQAKKNGLKPLKYKDDGEKISTILFNGLQYSFTKSPLILILELFAPVK